MDSTIDTFLLHRYMCSLSLTLDPRHTISFCREDSAADESCGVLAYRAERGGLWSHILISFYCVQSPRSAGPN